MSKSVKIELKNVSDHNIWFRFYYFRRYNEGKNDVEAENILESVMPRTHQTVYLILPKGAEKVAWMPWSDSLSPGKDGEFKEARVKMFRPHLTRAQSFTFDATHQKSSPDLIADDIIESRASVTLPLLDPSTLPKMYEAKTLTPRYRRETILKSMYRPAVLHLAASLSHADLSTTKENEKEENDDQCGMQDNSTKVVCRDGEICLSKNVMKWMGRHLPLDAVGFMPVETLRMLLRGQHLIDDEEESGSSSSTSCIEEGDKIASARTHLPSRITPVMIADSLSDRMLSEVTAADTSALTLTERGNESSIGVTLSEDAAKDDEDGLSETCDGPCMMSEVPMHQLTSTGLGMLGGSTQELRVALNTMDIPMSPTSEDTPTSPEAIERRLICVEFLEVEENYVASLGRLLDLRSKIVKEFSYLDKNLEINAVFGNADVILELNQILLENLRKAHRADNHDTIGRVFLKFAPFLKLYTAYLKDVDMSQRILKKLKRSNKQFRDFLSIQLEPIDSLLIRPVQQIPRYCLLLKELLKNTSANHADRTSIEQAAKKCEEVAAYCNETLELRRRSRLANIVKRRFGSQGLRSNESRLLLKEGVLLKVNRYGTDQERVFVLFSDALAYGVGTEGGAVDIHRTMYVGEFGIFEKQNTDECFEVRTKKKTFTVRTPSRWIRQGWISAIRGMIKDAGMESSQDKFWGEAFWGEKFSWEKKKHQAGDAAMWVMATAMFSSPPWSNGFDRRYTEVKKMLRKKYGKHAINETNKDRLKRLAVNRGKESFSIDETPKQAVRRRQSVLFTATRSMFGAAGRDRSGSVLQAVFKDRTLTYGTEGSLESRRDSIGSAGSNSGGSPLRGSPAKGKLSSKAAKLLGMSPAASKLGDSDSSPALNECV